MKRNIAIVAGGDTSEIVVSLRSAQGIYSFIDKEKYNLYIVEMEGRRWEVQLPDGNIKLILLFLSYILLFLAIFRTFSRNTYRRYEENRKFLMFFQRLRDRDHRYFYCPRCRQQVRVPRGKGTIAITCPKCREKFVKKT